MWIIAVGTICYLITGILLLMVVDTQATIDEDRKDILVDVYDRSSWDRDQISALGSIVFVISWILVIWLAGIQVIYNRIVRKEPLV